MVTPSQRERCGPRRGAALVVILAALALGVLGCFVPELLAYAPCERSDSCAEAGLLGCLRLPGDAEVRGSCTEACEADAACPPAPDGDATPRCAEVDGTRLCVLSCMDDETCPEGHLCRDASGVGEVARLCLPEAAP